MICKAEKPLSVVGAGVGCRQCLKEVDSASRQFYGDGSHGSGFWSGGCDDASGGRDYENVVRGLADRAPG